jgi:hypothetical protein
MKESCNKISELIEKYFDNEATSHEMSIVEDHLKNCYKCQEMLSSHKLLRDIIKRPVDEALEKEDFSLIWKKVKGQIQLEERPNLWEIVRSWFEISYIFKKKILIPTVSAIALLLIILLTPIFYKKTTSLSGLSVVEYVESQTHNVMVYESEKNKLTVIWLFEEKVKESPDS